MLRDFNFPFPEAIEGCLVYALNGIWAQVSRKKDRLARDEISNGEEKKIAGDVAVTAMDDNRAALVIRILA